jgi:hypothetical protein
MPVGYAFAVCSAQLQRGARAACADAPFAEISSENGQLPTPAITFEVPADLAPSGRILVLGVVCPDGSPDAGGSACVGRDPGTPVSLELELAREADVNQNPELEPESIAFDDDVWPEQAAVDGDCSGVGFVEVAVGSKHALSITLDESDRDALPRPSKLDPSRESLQLSHFTTGGDLTRAFETIAWDSGDLRRQVSWTAPKQPGLVRFWLVLRDFRGGGAFAERAVCVH